MMQKSKMKKIFIAAAFIVLAAAFIIVANEKRTEKFGHYMPSYEQKNIELITAEGITTKEYKELALQTGLGKDAIKSIVENNYNYVDELKKYQNNFFEKNLYSCEKITIITGEERSVDDKGNVENKFEIQGMQEGDIFVSYSTHSFGWRHGHAAIVTDAEKGETLEAVVLGSDSEIQYAGKWETYPTFIQLRIKDEVLEKMQITREEFADMLEKQSISKLEGVPYGLLTGIPVKYVENIKKTQCAHLVWYAYRELGIDIDSDGGWLVTPYDMANAKLLEIVQIYGVDPIKYMPF